MVPGLPPDDDDHPDGPLPLTTTWAGFGASLVGDPRWWLAHWQIRLAPTGSEPEDSADE